MYPFVKLTNFGSQDKDQLYINVNDIVMFEPHKGGGTKIHLRDEFTQEVCVEEKPEVVAAWIRNMYPR